MMVSVEDSSWRSLEVGSQVPTQQIFRHIRTARVQCCRWGRKTREGQTRALATARVLSNPRRETVVSLFYSAAVAAFGGIWDRRRTSGATCRKTLDSSYYLRPRSSPGSLLHESEVICVLRPVAYVFFSLLEDPWYFSF
ncbi:hypothetical protein V6N11_002123 [Hibiscus sabdariffa]|uniref:Uncharacterized protein n=1 Tax=Hibiscus sabdariffa TaxID=183260 RepID=A0ABR2QUC2_9ROSI